MLLLSSSVAEKVKFIVYPAFILYILFGSTMILGGKSRAMRTIWAAGIMLSAITTGAPMDDKSADIPRHITYDGMWEHHECDYFFDEDNDDFERPVDHSRIWSRMRSIHNGTHNMDRHSRDSHKRGSLEEETALQVPYQVKAVEGKGLGLFATAFIPQGTMVYDAHENRGGRVKFHRGRDFVAYMRSLADRGDSYQACLVLQCAAIEADRPLLESERQASSRSSHKNEDVDGKHTSISEETYIVIDLEDGCFGNADNDDNPNVGGLNHWKGAIEQQKAPDGQIFCKACDYALRDIQAGEELTWNYGDYVLKEGWGSFGLA